MSAELIKYTEAAMALLDGKLADIVYLPPDVRKNKVRINAHGRATTNPPSVNEQLDRILMADPLGFLLAVMNGQPVLSFGAKPKEVEPKKTTRRAEKAFPLVSLGKVAGVEIVATTLMPTLDDRKDVAKFLVPYVTERRKKKGEQGTPDDEEAEFEQILERRIQQAKDNNGTAEG